MIEFLGLPEERQRLFIDQVNNDNGMSQKAVEKDWWVTLVLKALFSLPMAQHFIFKGGTSLSKGWGLIERLSEDVDIAMSPEAFGKTYKVSPSHSYVKQLKKLGTAYTSIEIADAMRTKLLDMGVPDTLFSVSVDLIQPTLPDKDPQTILVHYASLYEPNPYIADNVKVELGVRSLQDPFADVQISSEIGKRIQVVSYTETPFIVRAVVPEKTMMEKLLLLHEKFSTDSIEELIIAERQSRHPADIVRLKQKGILERAMANPALFQTLVQHRRHYVRSKGINYDQITLQTLNIIPPPAAEAQFRQDYTVMRTEMIYGDAPDFDMIMAELRDLAEQLAQLG